ATDSGISWRFSLRRVAVTTMSATPSVGEATGWLASASGWSVSPVTWAWTGVVAKAQAVASAMSEVWLVRRIVVFPARASGQAARNAPPRCNERLYAGLHASQ